MLLCRQRPSPTPKKRRMRTLCVSRALGDGGEGVRFIRQGTAKAPRAPALNPLHVGYACLSIRMNGSMKTNWQIMSAPSETGHTRPHARGGNL